MPGKKTLKEFISQSKVIHKDKFLYDKVIYLGDCIKIKLFCVECKVYFEQIPSNNLRGATHKLCADKIRGLKSRMSQEEFINKCKQVHKDKYNYDETIYIESHANIKIYCNKCKLFFDQMAYHHMQGENCSKCINKTEKIVSTFLTEQKYKFIEQKEFSDLKRYKFDFYLKDYNLIIEVDGPQHFEQVSNWKDPKSTQKRDCIKMDYCIKNDISIIRILQDDIYNNKFNWCDELKTSILKYDVQQLIFLGTEKSIKLYDCFIDIYDK